MTAQALMSAAGAMLAELPRKVDSEIDAMISGNTPSRAYDGEFIEKIAYLSDSDRFDAGERLRSAFPREFKITEWRRRIKDARDAQGASHPAQGSIGAEVFKTQDGKTHRNRRAAPAGSQHQCQGCHQGQVAATTIHAAPGSAAA